MAQTEANNMAISNMYFFICNLVSLLLKNVGIRS